MFFFLDLFRDATVWHHYDHCSVHRYFACS